MLLYFLWDIIVQGPSGDETLRFSNRRYVVQSGPDTGESYRASWTKQSYDSFMIDAIGYGLSKDHVVNVGGIIPRLSTPLEFINSFQSIDATARELDFLFTSSYTLKGTVTGKLAVVEEDESIPVDGEQPVLADFTTFFTGILTKKTIRKTDTVVFYPEPTSVQTKGPMLTRRFNGMAGYLKITGDDISVTSPTFVTGDFTLQLYGGFDVGTVGPEGLIRIRDAALDVMFEVYYDLADDSLKIGVDNKTDTYTLLSLGAPVAGFFDFRFITISWNDTAGTFNAWINETQVFTDETIVNSVTGTETGILIGDFNFDATFESSTRIWSRVLTKAEVLIRLGAIDHTQETGLIRAWEYDEGRGGVVIDFSTNKAHIDISAVTFAHESGSDGTVFQEGKIKPIALGTVWSVPILVVDPKLDKGFISDVLFNILQVYSQGMPLVFNEASTFGVFNFNKDTRILSLNPPAFFGFRRVVNQKIIISSSSSGDFDGTFTIDALIPETVRRLAPSGDDFRADIQVVEPWPSTSTESALVDMDPNHVDWDIANRSSGYYTEPNLETVLVEFTASTVSPLFANVIGDRHILSTGAPGGQFNTPDFLDNILAQVLKTYGPGWDDTTFPPPVYSSLDHRVGYYIDDSKPTADVVNDLARGSLVWVVEDGDGVITLQEFDFPEDLSGPEIIDQESIISVEQPHFPLHGINELTTLNVNYDKSWTVMGLTAIPDAVDAETRAFITKEFRTLPIGAVDEITTETPTFITYENRKEIATITGNKVLRLSQGLVHTITLRMQADDQLNSFDQGALINGDLPRYGLNGLVGVSLGKKMGLTSGQVTVFVWSE